MSEITQMPRRYTVRDGAGFLGCSEKVLYKRLRDGLLAHHRFGTTGRIWFSIEQLESAKRDLERPAKTVAA